MKLQALPVWGLTIAKMGHSKTNRPGVCIYTAQEEADFIRYHLDYPSRQRRPKRKLIASGPQQRPWFSPLVCPFLREKETAKYVWGIGFHWYKFGMEDSSTWIYKGWRKNFPFQPGLIDRGLQLPLDWATFDQWQWGENYGENMINDFNQGSSCMDRLEYLIGWNQWPQSQKIIVCTHSCKDRRK